MLKQCQEDYTHEQLQWTHIDYTDNEPICAMIDNSAKVYIIIILVPTCICTGYLYNVSKPFFPTMCCYAVQGIFTMIGEYLDLESMTALVSS